MDLFPEAQVFLDGHRIAKKHKAVEEYVQTFLKTYRLDIFSNILTQLSHPSIIRRIGNLLLG